MRPVNRFPLFLFLVECLFVMTAHAPAIAADANMTDRLESVFTDPPLDARTRCYWWWLNGNVTKDAITRDLEQMKEKGFGGAMIFDADGSEQRGNQRVPAGPMFGTPAWRALFRHALQEAARLGLELSLSIQSGWNLGGPESVLFDALISWTERPENDIRFYSGTATYEKTFQVSEETLDANPNIALDLGELSHMASVRLNGRDLGVLWTPPFRVDVSAVLRPGQNRLEIEIVNNWTNRLVGDLTPPPGQGYTQTNILKTAAATPLVPSGLLGPVQILRASK